MSETREKSQTEKAIDEVIELLNKHIELLREDNSDGAWRLQYVIYTLLKERMEK